LPFQSSLIVIVSPGRGGSDRLRARARARQARLRGRGRCSVTARGTQALGSVKHVRGSVHVPHVDKHTADRPACDLTCSHTGGDAEQLNAAAAAAGAAGPRTSS